MEQISDQVETAARRKVAPSPRATESTNAPWRGQAEKRQPVDVILTSREAAPILKAHPRTLRRWAAEGYGPPRLRITPRRSGYRLSDINAWIANLTAANGRGVKNAA